MKTPPCIAILAVSLATLALPAHAELVASYDFEEGSGTTANDSAGGDDNGTIVGGAIHGSPGAPNNGGGFALDFNGTSGYLELGDNQNFLNGAPGVTLANWVNIDTLAGASEEHLIHISDGDSSSQTRALLRIEDNVQLQVGGRSNDTDAFQFVRSPTFASMGITTGQWFHLAGVLDYGADTIRIYINGLEITTTGTVNFSQGTASATDSLRSTVGAGAATATTENNFFDGRLDNVQIFNTALSGSEIAVLVPEPGSALLALAGGAGLLGVLRRRRSSRF